MKTLVIDIGNSLTKVAVFDGDNILFVEKSPNLNSAFVNSIVQEYHIQKTIISSVLVKNADGLSALANKRNFLWFNSQTKLPISNLYL